MLLTSVFCLCICVTLAIYPEQLGESDWLKRNVGYVTSSIFNSEAKKVFVSSGEDGVVACLHIVSGALLWRVVLSADAKIEGIVLGEYGLISLSSSPSPASSASSLMYTVSSWGLADGVLQWDRVLESTYTSSSLSSSSSALHSDLYLENAKSQLTVLAGNAIYFMQSQFGNVLWHWAPQQQQLDSMVILSRLNTATTVSSSSSSSRRVAIGCRLHQEDSSSSSSSNAQCLKTVVVVVSLGLGVGRDDASAYSAVVQELDPLPSHIPLSDYTPSFSFSLPGKEGTDGSSSSSSSVVFGSSRQGVEVLQLSSNKVTSLPFTTTSSSSSSSTSFLMTSIEGVVLPAVARCDPGQGQGQGHCSVEVVEVVENKGVGRLDRVWTLTPIVSCLTEGPQGGSGSGSGSGSGGSVKVGLERSAASASLANRVACVSVHASASASVLNVVSVLVSSTAPNEKSAPHTLVSATVLIGEGNELPFSAESELFYIGVGDRGKGKEQAQAKGQGTRLLVVGGAGSTLMVSVSAHAAPSKPASVLWRREEALARVQQAVVVDGSWDPLPLLAASSSSSSSSSSLDPPSSLEGGAGERGRERDVLSFRARMRLQALQLATLMHRVQGEAATLSGLRASMGAVADMGRRAVSSLSAPLSAPSPVPPVPKEGGGAPKDVARAHLFGFDKIAICL